MSREDRRGSVPRCPTCGRDVDQRYRPFCSARCRDIDLGNWLDGVYRVPAVEVEDDDLDAAPPARHGERTVGDDGDPD